MKKILIISLLLLSPLFGEKRHKIIIIELISQSCHFCKKMDVEVMSKKDVIEALERDFILIKLDVNRDKLPLGLKKGTTPTFAFANDRGELFSIIHGAWNREDFLDLLKYVKKKSKIKRELKK
jgi:thioredoxin-related protein